MLPGYGHAHSIIMYNAGQLDRASGPCLRSEEMPLWETGFAAWMKPAEVQNKGIISLYSNPPGPNKQVTFAS